MKFFYCAAEPDSEPVLMIRPRLEDLGARALKRHASARASTHGDVRSTNGYLVFEVEPAFEQRLETDLQTFFSKKVSALQSARVVVRTPTRSPNSHSSSSSSHSPVA